MIPKSIATLFCAVSFASAAVTPPNILVFLVDDMGVMDTSVPFLTNDAGEPVAHPLNSYYRTPNMQALADGGIRFEQFYANSVCSPSRVSLMTGQYSARHHVTNWINPTANNTAKFGPPDWQWQGITKGKTTLPEILHSAGYCTIHAGKGHFGPINSFGAEPRNFGFDTNIAGGAIGQPGNYLGIRNFGNGKAGNKRPDMPGMEKYYGKDIFLTEALTNEMKTAISDAVAAHKPFFAYMSHYAVHAPFTSDKRYAGHYPDNSGKNQQARDFATMIEGMDASLGQLLKHLKSLGVADNTLVLFLGDNGSDAPLGGATEIGSSAPLRGKKGSAYEGGMRVPFIAAWAVSNPTQANQRKLPIAVGATSREIGSIPDIFPTLLALTGTAASAAVDGHNLAPLLAGGKAATPGSFLMHYPHEHRSNYFTVLREGPWKLIYFYRNPAGNHCELYNLDKDPYESTNLADSESAQRDRMLKAMADSLKSCGAQYVRADNGGDTVLTPTVP